MVGFNRPPYTGFEEEFVLAAMKNDKIAGDGEYSKKCQDWFEKTLKCKRALLTPSCTHALEMAAILIDIQPGDEVIMHHLPQDQVSSFECPLRIPDGAVPGRGVDDPDKEGRFLQLQRVNRFVEKRFGCNLNAP